MSIAQAEQAKEQPDVSRAFYTDGGLKDGRGTAAYLEETNSGARSYSEVIYGLCSSYRAERRALIAVLQLLINERCRDEKIIIFSDSLSNIQSLGSPKTKHDEGEDVLLRKLLIDALNLGNTIALQFIRGHAGHPGNEWADHLCSLALNSAALLDSAVFESVTPQDATRLCKQHLKKHARQRVENNRKLSTVDHYVRRTGVKRNPMLRLGSIPFDVAAEYNRLRTNSRLLGRPVRD